MNVRLAIGTDHRGFALKEFLKTRTSIAGKTIEWHDVGCFSTERTDYPIYAFAVAEAVLNKKVDYGVVLCSNGVGVTIAANRCKGIYAGLAWDPTVARSAKEDDNINVLALPSDYMIDDKAVACIEQWLTANFKHDRYEERLAMLDARYHC